MSIDLSERLLSLTDAAKRLPARRAGKKPNVATLYRWTTIGCRGVVLEYTQVGGTRCTSVEALERFFSALAAQTGQAQAPPTEPTRLPKYRRMQIEQAQRELRAAGV